VHPHKTPNNKKDERERRKEKGNTSQERVKMNDLQKRVHPQTGEKCVVEK
jgi:hypothetical protein